MADLTQPRSKIFDPYPSLPPTFIYSFGVLYEKTVLIFLVKQKSF